MNREKLFLSDISKKIAELINKNKALLAKGKVSEYKNNCNQLKVMAFVTERYRRRFA